MFCSTTPTRGSTRGKRAYALYIFYKIFFCSLFYFSCLDIKLKRIYSLLSQMVLIVFFYILSMNPCYRRIKISCQLSAIPVLHHHLPPLLKLSSNKEITVNTILLSKLYWSARKQTSDEGKHFPKSPTPSKLWLSLCWGLRSFPSLRVPFPKKNYLGSKPPKKRTRFGIQFDPSKKQTQEQFHLKKFWNCTICSVLIEEIYRKFHAMAAAIHSTDFLLFS